MKNLLYLLIPLILLTVPEAGGVGAAKYRVKVTLNSEDAVGGRLGYHIKELIRKSSNMELISGNAPANFELVLVTIPCDKEWASSCAIYSCTINAYDLVLLPRDLSIYVTQEVGKCGGDRVASCAEGIVSSLDEVAELWGPTIQSGGPQTKLSKP